MLQNMCVMRMFDADVNSRNLFNKSELPHRSAAHSVGTFLRGIKIDILFNTLCCTAYNHQKSEWCSFHVLKNFQMELCRMFLLVF